MVVPAYDAFFQPVLDAIKRLGGSASIAELNEEATKFLNLTPQEIAEPHDERRTKVEYRCAWARTYLKAFGLLDNSDRGIWVLTAKGKSTDNIDPQQIKRFANQKRRPKQISPESSEPSTIPLAEIAEIALEQTWREELLAVLLNLKPDAFERLCQRLLRESGFVQVQVTGRTGDGGIDGVGIVRLGGLLGFPILFQCKRFRGSVGPSIIRDFRGAMVGRADRGLVITTGTFTRDAKLEATRDGAPPIDLVDGEQLLEKLKDLRLGVHVEMIEQVSVKPGWFKDI
jgi:restriction system protein